MKAVSLIFRILAILGACAAIAGAFLTSNKVKEAEDSLSSEQRKARTIQARLDEMEEESENVQKQMQGYKSDLKKAKADATRALGQVKGEKKKADQAVAAKASAEKALSRAKSDLKKAKAEVSKWKNQPQGPDESELEERDAKIASLNGKIGEYKDQITSLKTDLAKAKASQGTSSGEPKLANAIPSSVIEVNTRAGLVVLGGSKSLKKDMKVYIRKDGRRVARVQVSQVKSGKTVANILPGFSVARYLRPNDKIQLVP